jgi:hypothetical protein
LWRGLTSGVVPADWRACTQPQAHTYGTETIAHQLKDFVTNFPCLDQGRRKLLIESLVMGAKISKNKRGAPSLRPPFAFGFMCPDLAPRVGKAQVAGVQQAKEQGRSDADALLAALDGPNYRKLYPASFAKGYMK